MLQKKAKIVLFFKSNVKKQFQQKSISHRCKGHILVLMTEKAILLIIILLQLIVEIGKVNSEQQNVLIVLLKKQHEIIKNTCQAVKKTLTNC